MRIVPVVAVFLVSMTTFGLADQKAADACATKLTPVSQTIYEAMPATPLRRPAAALLLPKPKGLLHRAS